MLTLSPYRGKDAALVRAHRRGDRAARRDVKLRADLLEERADCLVERCEAFVLDAHRFDEDAGDLTHSLRAAGEQRRSPRRHEPAQLLDRRLRLRHIVPQRKVAEPDAVERAGVDAWGKANAEKEGERAA